MAHPSIASRCVVGSIIVVDCWRRRRGVIVVGISGVVVAQCHDRIVSITTYSRESESEREVSGV